MPLRCCRALVKLMMMMKNLLHPTLYMGKNVLNIWILTLVTKSLAVQLSSVFVCGNSEMLFSCNQWLW